MAVAKMKKVTLLGHVSVKTQLTKRLQEQGLLQIISAREEDEIAAAPEHLTEQLHALELAVHKANFLLSFLGGFVEEKKSFIRSMMAQRVYVTRGDYETIDGKIPFEELYERCEELDDELQGLRSTRGRMTSQLQALRPWAELDLPLSARGGTEDAALLLGVVPSGSLEAAREELVDAVAASEFVVVSEAGQQAACAVLVHRSVVDEAQAVLARNSFKPAALDGSLRAEPRREIQAIERDLKDLDHKEQATLGRIKKLTALIDDILVLREHLQDKHDRASAEERFYHTKHAFLMEGWCTAADAPAVADAVKDLMPAVEVAATNPDADDVPPVVLDNPRLFKPFEALMRLYGYPSHDEIDPTIVMAPFFFIFFGMALGDFGYGLVLALGCCWGIRRFDLQGNVKNFMHLMIYGGIGSMLVGVLTGGYFGVEMKDLPAFLRALVVIDPLNQALEFMIIAVALGVVQVILGVILEGIDAVRHGDWATALFDQATTVAVLITAIGSFVGALTQTVAGKLSPAAAAVYSASVLGLGLSAAALVLLQGRVHEGFRPALTALAGKDASDVAQRGRTKVLLDGAISLGLLVALYVWVLTFFVVAPLHWPAGQALLALFVAGLILSPLSRKTVGRVSTGAFNLYGMSGFIGDFLSYARLMAIGLATVLIGMVINLLAKMLFPGGLIGIAFGLLVLVVGHSFNLIINLLGAFVHPTRLQFVEFFGKFYDDGGEKFFPLAIRTKHLIFVPEDGT